MKTISLWQPWASLIAFGEKHFETRSWRIRHQGPIAIHVTAKWNPKVLDWLMLHWATEGYQATDQGILRKALERHIVTLSELPLGCVLAVGYAGKLTKTRHADRMNLSRLERAAGDWSDRRWAKEIEDVRRFHAPIPAKGKQGLWDWEPPENWAELLQPRKAK